ncbi:MAG: glycosyltransferase family 4 protein [Candidatus Neomarinimicrobiota bacterium]
MPKRILVIANTSWYIYNFRFGLLKALLRQGIDITVVAPKDSYSSLLRKEGCAFVDVFMDNKGLNPISDLVTLVQLFRIYRQSSPDLVIHYTVKPVLYGSLAARLLDLPTINNITGFGTAFLNRKWVAAVVKRLYRVSQKRASRVVFQNCDDQAFFVEQRLIPEPVAELIPGTGIDTSLFMPQPYSQNDDVVFLLMSRMIWDKGIGEFVEAARRIKSEFSEVRFQLLGFLDVSNRTAISREQMQIWAEQGIIEYLGETDDVRPYISNADCLVLPSYREGLPRALLEAAAMARPVIATDTEGCREVVNDGINGYLCQPRNAEDLAEKMEKMIRLSVDQRRAMGLRGRKKIEEEFDEKVIVRRLVSTVNQILARS